MEKSNFTLLRSSKPKKEKKKEHLTCGFDCFEKISIGLGEKSSHLSVSLSHTHTQH
ncbi:hypothetical protein LguiB_031829 [Lonicera macranthoides]